MGTPQGLFMPPRREHQQLDIESGNSATYLHTFFAVRHQLYALKEKKTILTNQSINRRHFVQ